MQFCVFITAEQHGKVRVEADSEEEAIKKALDLYTEHRVSWYDSEITDIFSEEIYTGEIRK